MFDEDAGADAAERIKPRRIPIRKTETTMRFGASNAFRCGCAVDAVAWEGKAEPSDADGVVGSIHKDLLGGFAAFWGIGIIWVRDE